MSSSLKRTTSTRNSRVTLITPATLPPPSTVKPEPRSPTPPLVEVDSTTSTPFTALRRSTRSTAIPQDASLSKNANAPPTPSPRKRVKVEHVDAGAASTPIKTERPSMATPKSSAKKLPQLALEKPHKAPEKWEEQYRLIEKMRRGIVAPVDDM